MDATIIIPTYKREDALLETLAALARMDYPAERWEAVVVDDGSGDETENAVTEWIANAGIRVRYLQQKNAGPAAARNRGAAAARGEVLIFIDNDIVVEPDFVRAHLETLSAHPGCWVVGRVVHPAQLRATAFGRYRDSLWEAFHHSHSDDRVSVTAGLTAANLSLPAQDFQRLGGFDEDYTIASCEDWDLGMRARQSGIRVMYNPKIVALHNDWAVSLERFCERQRLYSISDVLLWRKYGEASPRAPMVRENSPVSWSEDSLKLIVKKSLKLALATALGRGMTNMACRLFEYLAPDSRLCRRAYDAAIAIAIFRGAREGLKRYGPSSAEGGDRVQFEKV